MKPGANRPFVVIAFLLASTLVALQVSDQREPESLAQPLDLIPTTIAGWSGSDNPALEDGVIAILKPSAYLSRTYRKGSESLGLFVAYYSHQSAGESMHSPKNCLPGSGWEVSESGTTELSLSGERVTINRYVVRNGLQRSLVLYWYQSKDRVFASEYYGKMCLVWDALAKGRTAGSIVRVTLPYDAASLQEGSSFAARVIPEVQRCLGG